MRAAALDELIAVIASPAVGAALPGFTLVENPDPDAGQGDSLRLGIQKAQQIGAGKVLIALGDMPFITATHLHAVLAACNPDRPAAGHDGMRPMPPAAFPATFFDVLLKAAGDHGAADLIRDLPPQAYVTVPRAMLCDIDHPTDVTTLRDQRPDRA